jgi:Tfp pilus assembly protein PilF
LEEPGGTYCVWVLWAKDATLIGQARDLLDKEESFSSMVRTMQRLAGDKVKTNLDCLVAGNMDPLIYHAIKNLEVGQVSEIIAVNQGLALIMRTTDHYRRMGYDYYDQGQYAKAEQELLKDLRLHPHSAEVWHLLAMCRSAQGKLKESVEAMDQALALDPNSASVLQDKATTLVAMGKYNQAMRLFERALSISPENPLILSNLAWTLAKMGKDLKRAEWMAKQALAIKPKDPRFWNTMGTVQLAQGRHAEALASFHQTANLNPNFPNLKENMLKCLTALNSNEVSRLASLPQIDKQTGEEAAKVKPKGKARKGGKKKAVVQNKPRKIAKVSKKASAAPKIKTIPSPKPKKPVVAKPAKPMHKKVAVLAKEPAPEKPRVKLKAKPEPAPKAKAVMQAVAPKPANTQKRVKVKKPAKAPQPVRAKRRATAKKKAGSVGPVYSIQVSTYRSLKLAKTEVRRWRRLGQESYVEKYISKKTGDWWRVFVGIFPNRPAAVRHAQMLMKKGKIKDFLLLKRNRKHAIQKTKQALSDM